MSSESGQRWVVVGGGMAGLLAARRLAGHGHQVTLVEAGESLGGRVARVEVAGLVLDAGAESFATRGGSVERLCEELGLAEAIVPPTVAPAWVIAPDRAYPLPSTGWLGVPLKPFVRDVRRVLGWRGSLRACLDLFVPTRGIGDDATVGEVSRRRLGRTATERLLEPVMSGVYSRPLDDLPLNAIADGLAADVRARGGLIRAARARRASGTPGAAVRGIEGGVATLAQAVADQAAKRGVALRAGTEVRGLGRTHDGWRLDTSAGPLDADRVVLAIPRHRAAALLGEAAEEARLVAIVTLVLDAPELDAAPRGTGVLVRPGVTRAKALTHSTAKWRWLASSLPPGRHVVRLSYAVTPGEDVRPHAVADASRLLGVALTDDHVLGIAQNEWPDASPFAVDNTEPQPGLHLVGSAAGLSGLAAIVAADAAADFS